MEQKFQSSFIPKGPLTSGANNKPVAAPTKRSGFFGIIAFLIFIISLFLAIGVFGYKIYLQRSISTMGEDLDRTEASLDPVVIEELIRLNNRIISIDALVAQHVAVSPFMEFLEGSTLRTVRFGEFSYTTSPNGIEVTMSGEAAGYSSLALQADVFDQSGHFSDQLFSELTLNQVGNVTFTYKAMVDSSLFSYGRMVESILAPVETGQIPAETEETEEAEEGEALDQNNPI